MWSPTLCKRCKVQMLSGSWSSFIFICSFSQTLVLHLLFGLKAMVNRQYFTSLIACKLTNQLVACLFMCCPQSFSMLEQKSHIFVILISCPCISQMIIVFNNKEQPEITTAPVEFLMINLHTQYTLLYLQNWSLLLCHQVKSNKKSLLLYF